MVDKEYSNLTIQFVSWVIQRDHVEYQINLFNDIIKNNRSQSDAANSHLFFHTICFPYYRLG